MIDERTRALVRTMGIPGVRGICKCVRRLEGYAVVMPE